MASKSSAWGALGWWIILAASIPFAGYAAIFILGDFELYRQLTITWLVGKHDIAGLNILHHIRAWQIHAAAAEVFIATGPFQFSPSFRATFPVLHRVFGYLFVAAAFVSVTTALLFLIPNTEFGPLAQAVLPVQALLLLYFLFVAVTRAKEKKFQVHRRYMIRAAATGYSVLATRPLPMLLERAGLSLPTAMEISILLAPIIFLSLAELYIRRVLLEPKETPASTDDVQTASIDDAHVLQEGKKVRRKGIQARAVGQLKTQENIKLGGGLGGDLGQGGKPGVGREGGSKTISGRKFPDPPIAWNQEGGPHYWWIGAPIAASQQCRIINKLGVRCGCKRDDDLQPCFRVDRNCPNTTCQVVSRTVRFPKPSSSRVSPPRGGSASPTFVGIQPPCGMSWQPSISRFIWF